MKRGSLYWYSIVSTSGSRASLFLIVVSLLCFLPGFVSLPAVDRDEARYAQASRQMVASGDWIDIRLQEAPRHKQPAGIYWAQSLFVSLLGENGNAPIWVHRLPSLIAAIASVLLTYWIAIPLVGAGPAFLAGMAMAGSLILGVEARLAKTDATLLATILTAQGVLARVYLSHKLNRPEFLSGRRSYLLPLAFWTALAVGALVKGPLILLFVGFTAVSLAISERSVGFLSKLRPLPGTLWFLAIVLPWYIAIGIRTDGLFYEKAIGFNIVGKISQGHEGHGAPPFTHLAWFWGIFWPGSILFALSLGELWKRRREPWLKFLICWTVPSWIAFELITTKLPHYLLPVFPAIAIATAGVLGSRPWIVRSLPAIRLVKTAQILLSISSVFLITAIAWKAQGETFNVAVVAAAILSLLAFSLVFRWSGKALASQNLPGFYCALVFGVISFYWLTYPLIARVPFLWPGPQIAKIIAAESGEERPLLISAGYEEPSLVFNTRTDIVLASGGETARLMAESKGAIAILEKSQLPDFLIRKKELNLVVKEIGEISAANIGGGDLLELKIVKTP